MVLTCISDVLHLPLPLEWGASVSLMNRATLVRCALRHRSFVCRSHSRREGSAIPSIWELFVFPKWVTVSRRRQRLPRCARFARRSGDTNRCGAPNTEGTSRRHRARQSVAACATQGKVRRSALRARPSRATSAPQRRGLYCCYSCATGPHSLFGNTTSELYRKSAVKRTL